MSVKKTLAIVGAAVAGFAAGILTAPKSGKETREDIKNKAEDLKKSAGEKAEQAKSAAKDSFESVKTGAKKVGDATAQTAHDVKNSVEKNFK